MTTEPGSADQFAAVRAHLEKHADKERAMFSIAGVRALLDAVDALSAPEAAQPGAAVAWRWRTEIFREWNLTDDKPGTREEMEAATGLNMSGIEVQPLFLAPRPAAPTDGTKTCRHGIRWPWACHECDEAAWPPSSAAPTDGDIGALVERLNVATMRTDWNNLPDDACIPAVPLLREAATALAAMSAKLADAERKSKERLDRCWRLSNRAETAEAKLADAELANTRWQELWDANVQEMSERFRAVNLSKVMAGTNVDLLERATAAEAKLAEVERERDQRLEELGRVIMACPQGMRTSPASDGVRQLRAAYEARQLQPEWRPTHQHMKRRSLYRFVGKATLQTSLQLRDMDAMVVYQAEDGSFWVRPDVEFYDGRFLTLGDGGVE